MIALQVARIIALFVSFCDLSDEDTVDLRQAVKHMEYLGYLFTKMDKDFLQELKDAFPKIADEYTDEARELVLNIPESFDFDAIIAGEYDE